MKSFAFFFLILLLAGAVCATDVSGNQSGTWTLMNSPYNVIGDVTIPMGGDLLIQPGVLVNVTGNFRITAQGTLTATGTEADTIRFVSTMADPNALWGGIRLENEVMFSNIQFCYIEKASYGINSINSPANISYNRFNRNEKGIQLYAIGETNPATVTVDYNLFEYSVHNAILVTENSNGLIEHNEIRYNGTGPQYRGAIQLANQSAGGSCSPTIQNNHIHHNFKQGITAWDILGVNAIQPQILNNLIEYNLTGIYLLNSSGYVADNIIRYNFIAGDANSGAGVMVAGATSQPYFERNDIHGNYTGFYLGNDAQPCLGDLSIYHSWAQGENQIHDNIDGTNTLHSVYTYSYTNPNIIISAENNSWGTDDPAQIALGINDHVDNPSLPTVDFEPFLVDQVETVVTGFVEYYGIYTLANHRIQFVGGDSGEIIYELPVDPSQPFSFSQVLTEPFHVVVLADVVGVERTLYGSPGGLLLPGTFTPGDLVPVDVGGIEIEDTLPPRYQEVGAPQLIGTRTCHPLYNSFFVYHWAYINWLYQEDDYLFLSRHERYNDAQNIIFNFPDGTIWDKVDGLGYNDAWMRTEILDDDGTLRQSVFRYKLVTDDTPVGRYMCGMFIQRESGSNALISVRMIGDDLRRLYNYDPDGYVRRAENITPNDSDTYLVEGNDWSYSPLLQYYQPLNLCLDYVEHYGQNPQHLTLYWQSPMDDGAFNWTHYRVFEDGELFAEVPFSQNYWHTETLPLGYYNFTVAAWDGSNLSAPTNILMVTGPQDTDDETAVPPTLSIHPNPASLSAQGGPEILIRSGKSLDGEVRIYNLRGQLVRSVPVASEGDFSWRWDLRDAKGGTGSSGLYFLKAEFKGEKALQARLVLLK